MKNESERESHDAGSRAPPGDGPRIAVGSIERQSTTSMEAAAAPGPSDTALRVRSIPAPASAASMGAVAPEFSGSERRAPTLRSDRSTARMDGETVPGPSDDALRVAAAAAAAARSARQRSDTGDRREGKRPRRSAGQRPAGTTGTAARMMHALEAAHARPICEGGLAHYFISEANRRWQVERSCAQRGSPQESALLAIASLPDARAGHGQTSDCVICMTGTSGSRATTLSCGHTFHRKCIVSWLQVKGSCPCCRACVTRHDPYCYPARTKVRESWLRARMERRLVWRDVALRTQFCDGMTDAARELCEQPSPSLAPVATTGRSENVFPHPAGCN